MSDTPMQVLTRPFAIEPVTNIMLPDGIFDNAIYGLRIAAHVTNMSSSALTNVTVYLESVGDPGIVPVARTFFFASIAAASRLRRSGIIARRREPVCSIGCASASLRAAFSSG